MSDAPLAMLFTDMEGSTKTSSIHGDHAAMELLRVHELLVRKAATAHEGRVVKSTGDGYLLAFNDPVAAVAGALEIRNGLADHNATHTDHPVRVRLGVNVGPAIEEGGDLYGLAVNTAARITAKAAAGQVLVSEAVQSHVAAERPDWIIVDRGLFWLKGIRQQWRLYEITDRSPTDPISHVTGRMPFVDRDAPRAVLRRHVDAANDGHGSFVLVSGDAGSGKTRLVEEVGAEAQGRGLQFFVGRCYEAATDTAYGPVLQLLDHIQLRLGPTAFDELIGTGRDDLSRVFPQLRQREGAGNPSDAPEWPVQKARVSLFAAIRDVVSQLSVSRPLVVMIDDLHWADEATLRLLEYLAAELSDLPTLVVCTYGEEDLAATSAFRPFLAALHRRRLVDSLSLPPFAEADVAELLATIGGSAAPPSLVALLHDATGGNPFFLEEVVRHLATEGHLLDDGGRWRSDLHANELHVPESVRFTIERRLDDLSEQTRRVLTTAATVGRDFGFELLEELSELSDDELLDALDEAERSRLVMATDDGGIIRFSFEHGLIRRTLANEISLTRRQRLHLRIANALDKAHADVSAAYASDVAFHLLAAGRWAPRERTAATLRAAGDHAISAAAYEDALRHFNRALALVGDDPAIRAAMLEKIGMAERSLGHLDDALSVWEEALAAHESIGARDEIARLCLTAAIQVAWWRRGGEVVALVERGLDALEDDESALRGGLLALAGGVASQAGSYDQASRLFDEALQIARNHGDDAILGLALYSLATHHFSYYQYANVVSVGRASMKHLRQAGDVWNLANVQGYVAASLGWLGRFDEAAELGRETMPFAERLGNWSAFVFAEGGRAFVDIGSRPAVEVIKDRAIEAIRLGEELGYEWLSAIGHTRAGLAAFFAGDWHEALRNAEDAARREGRTATGGQLGRLVLLHAYLGRTEEARALLAAAESQFAVVGRPNSGTAWTLALTAVEAYALLGDRARAAALYPVVVDHAATGAVMRSWDYRLVSTLAGIAAGAGGDWDVAELHFGRAREQATALPLRHEEPECLRFHAGVLLDRGAAGDAAKARRMLAEAESLYEELQMVRHAALARSMRVE